MFYLGRARVRWLNLWDTNTKFFHQTVLCRSNNRGVNLKDLNGEWCNDPDVLAELIQGHFSNSVFWSYGCHDIDEVLQAVNRVITKEMNKKLTKMSSHDEVKVAEHLCMMALMDHFFISIGIYWEMMW